MGVQQYLKNLLENQLREIKYRYREKIVTDIKDRMCSLLIRWDNDEYKTTILFVTDEEALFYEPSAPIEVKEFVVATLRNSMLELAASVNCDQFKMQEPLSNDKIKQLTSEAIIYFGKCDFGVMQKEVENIEFRDVFGEAIQKYPLAWELLKKTALLKDEKLEFGETEKTVPEGREWVIESQNKKTICDGYSLEFDTYLKEELEAIISGNIGMFYVDSFKTLTRNFEKILHVLQIVIEHNSKFVTCNYYISDGYIEKRKIILRAAHSEKVFYDNMRNRRGTPSHLREVLKNLAKAE